MRNNEKVNITVIGTGMAARKFLEELDRFPASTRYAVTVTGESRTSDGDWLHQAAKSDIAEGAALFNGEPGFPRNIALTYGAAATRIRREDKCVETATGASVPYDYLVIATGSSPLIPDIEGSDLEGVFTYQGEGDLKVIRANTSRCAKATVLGGGLLGFKAAKACVDAGIDTTLLEYDDLLMPRHLADPQGLLNGYMTAIGIRVRTDARPKCLSGRDRVSSVRLIGDALIPTDLVILSADIRSNDRLARAAGIPVAEEGGIIVDGRLRTADPTVFAIGECASVGGMVCGLVSPGFSMATVLAANFCGRDTAFEAPDMNTKLRRLGLDPDCLEESLRTRPTRRLRVLRKTEERPLVFTPH